MAKLVSYRSMAVECSRIEHYTVLATEVVRETRVLSLHVALGGLSKHCHRAGYDYRGMVYFSMISRLSMNINALWSPDILVFLAFHSMATTLSGRTTSCRLPKMTSWRNICCRALIGICFIFQ